MKWPNFFFFDAARAASSAAAAEEDKEAGIDEASAPKHKCHEARKDGMRFRESKTLKLVVKSLAEECFFPYMQNLGQLDTSSSDNILDAWRPMANELELKRIDMIIVGQTIIATELSTIDFLRRSCLRC